MPIRSVRVKAPATSANLGPGFDSLGLALDLWGEAEVEVAEEGHLPSGEVEEIVSGAVRAVSEALGWDIPDLAVSWRGEIPVGRGLGASAALRAAGLLAANAMAGDQLGLDELLVLGAKLEGHADNMAPALLGGFQVTVWDGARVTRVGLPPPSGLKAVLFVPDMVMPTQESRKLLPEQISRQDAVHNISRTALLVAALAEGRWDTLDVATQDRLHQPARSKIFPAMYDLFRAAKSAGALCAYLSGGGSAIMAFAERGESAVGRAMLETAQRLGVGGRVMVTEPTAAGAQVTHRR